jgi:S-formylglutathione hydrolase FrmB
MRGAWGRGRFLPVLAVLALWALAAAPGASADPAQGPGALKLITTQRLDGRLSELTFSTPALSADTGVRVMLPTGYAAHPRRRYPVLYLLNGSLGNETDWTVQGDAEALTAGLPLIVVMPSGGSGGYYSDWYNGGAGGPPEWETYHIDELLPWIDQHYRTLGTRAGRAIAGLSMGGFGAFSYPARHPELFVAAASFSGALDTNDPSLAGQPDESTFDGGVPYSTWGTYQTNQINWRAHDPFDLAENLRGLELVMRTGNGQPGGPYPYSAPAGVIEADVHQANIDMDAKLTGLRIPHFFQDYGPGDHSWPYWQRDLRLTLPQIMATFARPPAPPSPVTFTAAEPSYSGYGWSVHVDRQAKEFSTLSGANARGFSLSGSGTATVTTPARFRPRSVHAVTITAHGGHRMSRVRADGAGRIELTVPLGPSNPQDEFSPGATTVIYTSTVVISPRRTPRHRARALRRASPRTARAAPSS